jgi:hypothetical protein
LAVPPIDYRDQDFVKEIDRLTERAWTSSSIPSVALTSGSPARPFVLAGRRWARAFVPRCVGTDWLQVKRMKPEWFRQDLISLFDLGMLRAKRWQTLTLA